MDSNDAVKILEACKGLNLKSLTLGNLKLQFHPDLTNETKQVNNSTNPVLMNGTPLQEYQEVKPSKDADHQNSEYMEEFLNANLMAADPQKFEEELLRKVDGQ